MWDSLAVGMVDPSRQDEKEERDYSSSVRLYTSDTSSILLSPRPPLMWRIIKGRSSPRRELGRSRSMPRSAR